MNEFCPLCLHDRPRGVGEMTDGEKASISEMMVTRGWELYQEILRRELADKIVSLVNKDGDGRVQLARQMECRALLERLAFEQRFVNMDHGVDLGSEDDQTGAEEDRNG